MTFAGNEEDSPCQDHVAPLWTGMNQAPWSYPWSPHHLTFPLGSKSSLYPDPDAPTSGVPSRSSLGLDTDISNVSFRSEDSFQYDALTQNDGDFRMISCGTLRIQHRDSGLGHRVLRVSMLAKGRGEKARAGEAVGGGPGAQTLFLYNFAGGQS